jgi:hypothetical protein
MTVEEFIKEFAVFSNCDVLLRYKVPDLDGVYDLCEIERIYLVKINGTPTIQFDFKNLEIVTEGNE